MKMEQEYNSIKKEDGSHIEVLLEKPFIKEERDIPDYVEINSFSDINLKPETVQPIFRCSQCPRTYINFEYLAMHTAIHEPDMSCPTCCELFTCRKQFRLHINHHIRLKMCDDRRVIYTCTYCLKNFNSKKNHTIHLRVHTNERPHKCKICGEGFKQQGALKDHHVTHTKERKYVCEICSGAYTTSSSLKRHKRKIHDKGKTMNCNRCTAKFQNKADFNAHRSSSHPCTNFKRTCRFCSAVLLSNLAYKTHIQLHIDNFRRNRQLFVNYMCSLCGDKTDNFKVYLKHRHWHLSYSDRELKEAIKLKLFKCKFCPIVYKTKQYLFYHMNLHLKQTVKCDLCQDQSTYLGLRAHKRRVHQMLNCRVCHKVISGKSKLYDHYKKHHKNLGKNKMKMMLDDHHRLAHQANSVKNFKCDLCGKRFLTRDALMTHKKNVHRIKVKFKCFECDTTFDTLKEISEHKITHHNKDKIAKKIFHYLKNYKTHASLKMCVNSFAKQRRLHACHFCERNFVTEYRLRNHLRLHSGYKFQCQFCVKKCKMIQTIQRHMKVHHPDKDLYWCNVCGESFDTLSNCEKHSSLHVMTKVAVETVLEDCAGCSDEIKVES